MILYPDVAHISMSNYLKEYISQVPSSMHLMEALDYSNHQLLDCLNNINEEKSRFRYQENKWSIKTMVVHIIDADRIFQYRALCIARGDQQNLPPFEENEYAKNSLADQIAFSNIIKEYQVVAEGFKLLFENLHPSTFHLTGSANHTTLSSATIGFIAAGHRLHHLKILKERYLI